MSHKPYIVLIGDVGAGKSTLVEKICDEIGRSSNADQSYTRSCEVIESYDRSLEICDTPGSNPMADKATELPCLVRFANAISVLRPVAAFAKRT